MAAALSASLICSLGSQPGDTLLSKVNQRMFDECSEIDLISNSVISAQIESSNKRTQEIILGPLPDIEVPAAAVIAQSDTVFETSETIFVTIPTAAKVTESLEKSLPTGFTDPLTDECKIPSSTFKIMIDTGKFMLIFDMKMNGHISY